MQKDIENELFNMAADVVNYTSCNLFLTGKAGTGKTTFLKYIKEHTHKNAVVVAPTGVAAINAGGVTMHSFFQLPFTPFISNETKIFGNSATTDKHTLIRNIRFNKQKIELINELELLIIDEVSMLRADMLDAIDEILRYFRNRRNEPFGGVQVLFIGDLFQLPPVVLDEEWIHMKGHYESPFFFSAKVIEQNPPLFIELKKIYRQSEQEFIQLLNNIRNNEMNEDDYELLHQRYRPEAMDTFDTAITLTTHNRTADRINQHELNKLESTSFRFSGEIKGDFSDKALPTEMHLELKEGAQIMFIKNDTSPEKRYFNGKLATIKRINETEITVVPAESEYELILEKETWENIRYSLNKETNKVEEEEIGSFTQFPVRLAWAITIHKSQGLTFDKAVIDAGSSFASGQVYVALSRCRSLQGVVLLSRISAQSVQNDERIISFASRENKLNEIKNLLLNEKPKYAANVLVKVFDWSKLEKEINGLYEETENKKIPGKDVIESNIKLMQQYVREQLEIADKFSNQLSQLLNTNPINDKVLHERVTKAKTYFASRIHKDLIIPVNTIQTHLKDKTKVKKYALYINELESILWKKLNDIQRVTFGDLAFEIPSIERTEQKISITKKSPEKGSSKVETLNFYKEGKTIAEIAEQRGMAISTIESHLADCVLTGEINIFDFATSDEIEKVKQIMSEAGYDKLSPIKSHFGEAMSYGKIKMVMNYIKTLEKNSSIA